MQGPDYMHLVKRLMSYLKWISYLQVTNNSLMIMFTINFLNFVTLFTIENKICSYNYFVILLHYIYDFVLCFFFTKLDLRYFEFKHKKI